MALNRYETTKDGRVVHYKQHIMVTQFTDKGYERLQLFKGGKKVGRFVHQLVAKAFVPNPNGYLYINHKDFNPKNNRSNNLEWCTIEYNNRYSIEHGRYIWTEQRRKNHKRALLEKQAHAVIATRISDGKVFFYDSEMSAARDGHHLSSISRCCNGKARKHHGYKWRFATDEEKKTYIRK